MKLKTFLAVAVIAVFTACSSTRYRASDTGLLISIDAQRAFEAQYPNSMNVVWSTYDPNIVILNDWELSGWTGIDRDDYEVRFDMDGEKYYAWYDQNGEWIGTAYAVNDYNKLPAYIHSTINTSYPGFSITSVNREFQKDNRIVYEVVLKNSTTKTVLLMDADGNVIKSKTKPL